MRPVKNRKWRKRIRVLCAWALIALLCCPSLSITGNIGLQGEIGGHSQVLAAEADAGQENQESGSEDPAGDNGAAPQNEEGGNNGSEDNGSEGGNNGSEGNGEEDGSGDSGNTGNEGGSSDSGDTGSEGGSGDSGNTGNTGSEGGSGDSGNTGDSGSEGGSDDSGNTGNTGEEGGSGNSGNTGSEGGSGNSGNTGSEGGSGDTGDTGEEGGSGNTGNTGEEGGSGNSGNTGSEGSGTDGKEESSGTPGSPAVPGGTQGGTEGNTGLPGDTLIPGEGEGLLEKEDGLTDEEKMPGEEEEEKKDPEEEELEVPDPMTVEFLEKVMGLSDDGTAQARPMRAPAKDGTDSKVVYEIGVKAQDKDTDTSLSGTNIPTKIPMGWIEDAGITADVEVGDKHYTFCGVTVDGNPCVFIGQYENTVYYSTDGVGAIALGENDVVLNYWEYYEVTMSAVGADVGDNLFATGTITVSDSIVDSEGSLTKTKETLTSGPVPQQKKVKVYQGEKLEWSVETGYHPTTYAPYVVSNIAVMEGNSVIETYQPEYKEPYEYEEQRNIGADTQITVTFDRRKEYRVIFDEAFLYTGDPAEVPDNTNILPDGITFEEGATEVEIGFFHTRRDMKLDTLYLNGNKIGLPENIGFHTSSHKKEETTFLDQESQTTYKVTVEAYKRLEGNINVWEYGYKITVETTDGKGIYKDLCFEPSYIQMENSSLKLNLTVNHQPNPAGIDIVEWDNGLCDYAEGTQYAAASTIPSSRTTYLFLFNVKMGYHFDSVTHENQAGPDENEGWNRYEVFVHESLKTDPIPKEWEIGTVDNLKSWEAKKPDGANAYADQYEYAVRFASNAFTQAEDQYVITINVVPYKILIRYSDNSSGTDSTTLPIQTQFDSIDNIIYTIKPQDSTSTEVVYPKREGYRFAGWTLKNDEEKTIYQPNERFHIDESVYKCGFTEDKKDLLIFEFNPIWIPEENYYTFEYYLPDEKGNYPEEPTVRKESAISVEVDEEIFIVPIGPDDEENYKDFVGFEPDWDNEENIVSTESEKFDEDERVLKLYYQKERKAYVDYTWEENPGDTHSEDWNDREGYIWEDRERGNSLGIGEKFYLPEIEEEEWPEGKKFEGWKLTNDSSGQTYQANKEFEITEENWSSVILHKPEMDGSHEDWYQYEFYPVWETVAADLTIEKKVTGPFGSHSKEFDFTLMAAPPEDMEDEILAGKTYNVTGKDGLTEITFAQISATEPLAATFKLKAGDTITIEDLPVGWTYTITETGTENYKASVQLNDGQKKESEEGKDATQEVTLRTDGDTVVYTNHCTITVPETGVHLPVAPWTMMLLMTAGMGAVYVLGRRRRQ